VTRARPLGQNAVVFWPRTALITLVAAGLVLFVAVALSLVPLWTGPALPAGATRLHITTDSSPRFGCMAALMLPVRITGSEDELTLVSVASGEPAPVVWPSGYAAWRIGGRAVLAGPYGNVIGREGDVLDRLGGGLGPDDAFHVCGAGEGLAGLIGQAPWFLLVLSLALAVVVVAVPRGLVRRRQKRVPAERADR
jgi:hypothetical protein